VLGLANDLFLYATLAIDAFLEPGAMVEAVLFRPLADFDALHLHLVRDHAQQSLVPHSIPPMILQLVSRATPLRLLELAELFRVRKPDQKQRDLRTTKA
jgi:hypothetical protein